MPREGVPYPERVLCSLKNTIAMIEQKLGLKIEKINGVGPDPSGNVTIVSDDAAITVEEDAAQHQVTIGLDRAELPSAAVTSVNGETGAVVLDASEIPYNDPDGYTDDVDEKLNVLTGVQNALQLSINQERMRAQNAESGLQTNINAEALTRSSNDTALQNQINALPTDTDVTQAVQDGLDNYASMVRTTGNQSIGGFKSLLSFSGKLKNTGVIGNTDRIELFRYMGVTNQDNRILIAIGDYLTVKFGTIPIEPSGSTIILKSVVASTTVMGSATFTVGASYAADGKIIISATASGNAAIWCFVMSAQTGSRFPIPESSFDFTHQGEAVTDTPIVTVTI